MVSVGVHVNTRLAFFKLCHHECFMKHLMGNSRRRNAQLCSKISDFYRKSRTEIYGHQIILAGDRPDRAGISPENCTDSPNLATKNLDFIILLKVRDGKNEIIAWRLEIPRDIGHRFWLSYSFPSHSRRNIFVFSLEMKLLFENSRVVVVIIFKGTRRQIHQQRYGKRKSAENKWLQYILPHKFVSLRRFRLDCLFLAYLHKNK